MKKCPVCGRYMEYKIIYVYGVPRPYWECACGYDEKRTTYVTSIRTTGGEFVRKIQED